MLSVCATPIGNLGDLTERVVQALAQADLVVCEDTRRTGRLLSHLGLEKPMLSFFEHNELRRMDAILDRLAAGEEIALVSDAGMPGISDPGFSLIRAALERGLPVTVLPGASAVDVALVSSGLPTDRFTFIGYLPKGEALLAAIETADLAEGTVVAFESPARVERTLSAIGERWPSRRLALCRELTKLHEEILRGTAREVAAALSRPVRGEIVLVLAPAERQAQAVGGDTLDRVITALLRSGSSVKEASRLASELSGLPARVLYDKAVSLRRKE